MFCVGICEGSCINPFWEVGRLRLFSKTFLKYPDPTPLPPPQIKNVRRAALNTHFWPNRKNQNQIPAKYISVPFSQN